MKTLHNDRFKKQSLIPCPVDEIRGYNKCMQDVIDYLKEVTEFNPEKRMIDSVPLLDLIEESAKELAVILKKEEAELNALMEKF